MKQIFPGFYSFTGLMFGRVYLIEDNEGLILVDTSIGSAPPKILKQLSENGFKPAQIKKILITHAHPDHVGGLRDLKEKTGAQVVASSPEADVIEGRIPVQRPPAESLSAFGRMMASGASKMDPIKVDRIVEDGEMVSKAMSGIQVIATPGHAPGHISFWLPKKQLLILGDVLFNTPSLRLPPSPFTVNMDENRRSVQKAADLAPQILCFGHGVPIMVNTAARLKIAAQKFSL